MATVAEDVVVKLTAELSGLQKGMNQGAAAVQGLEKKMSAAASRMKAALTAIGVGFAVREYVQLADASANLAARIRLVAGSAENAARVQKQLLDVANRTRVDFEGVVTLYSRLGRSADQLGISQDRLIGFTETFSQALKISGASTAEASSTVIQLAQALAAGELRGAELNSVLEQGGRAATALADGLGAPVGSLKKLGEAGELSAAKVIAAIESQSQKIQTEFNEMPQTVGDALTVVQNKLLNFVGKLDQTSGTTRELTKNIAALGALLDDPKFAEGIATALTGLVTVMKALAESVSAVGRAMLFVEHAGRMMTFKFRGMPGPPAVPGVAGGGVASSLLGIGEPPKASPSGDGGLPALGNSKNNEAARAVERYRDAVADLIFETNQLVRTDAEAAFQAELRNRLTAAGIPLYGALTATQERHKEAIEELTSAYISQVRARSEADAAWEVEAANANRVIQEFNDRMREQAAEWERIGDAIEDGVVDAFLGIVDGSQKASEAIAALIADIGRLIAKALILKAIEGVTDAVFGGSSGGKALGGLVNPGNAYMVGEAGPELFVPQASGNIVPNNRLGSGASINLSSTVYAAPGVNKAELQMMLDQRDADLVRRIPAIVRDRSLRGNLRLN